MRTEASIREHSSPMTNSTLLLPCMVFVFTVEFLLVAHHQGPDRFFEGRCIPMFLFAHFDISLETRCPGCRIHTANLDAERLEEAVRIDEALVAGIGLDGLRLKQRLARLGIQSRSARICN